MRHAPREIDIDVLMLGDVQMRHARMSLPHEQLLQRRFVLIPALELDFELSTPDGTRLSDALALLPIDEGVRWAGPALSVPRGRRLADDDLADHAFFEVDRAVVAVGARAIEAHRVGAARLGG